MCLVVFIVTHEGLTLAKYGWGAQCHKFSASMYLFKVNNRNTGTMFEICSKLTIKTSEQRSWHPSSVFNTDIFYSFYWCFYLLTLIRWIYSGLMLIYDQWKKTPEIWVVFHKDRHVFRTILWKPQKGDNLSTYPCV